MSSLFLPVSISTLADFRREGMSIWAHCAAPNSGHARRLDLDRLIEIFGEDHVVAGDSRIASAAVCPVCRHRGATLTVSHGHATGEVGARRENGGAN